MKFRTSIKVLLISAILASTTATSNDIVEHGGDVYLANDDVAMASDAARDAFVTGYSVEITGDITQDAHAAGFDVRVKGDVGGNLYAVGSNVQIDGRVGEDLTASGFTVRLNSNAAVMGNARIAGATVVIDAPVAGSLLASGATIKLNDSIQGDVRLTASDIKFGSDAVINGSLTYFAAEEIVIPSSVISSDRIRFTRIKHGDRFRELRDTVEDSVPDFWPESLGRRLTGLLALLAFLLIVSAVFLAFAPNVVERLRHRATEHAWRSIFYGFIGLSTLFGVIPVSAITLVGIPLIPVGIVALIVIWALGYLLGVYVIAARIWRSLDVSPQAIFTNLLILASGLIAMVVVNFIPFFGWVANLAVLFFGVGAMTFAVMERLVRRHEATSLKTLPEPSENFYE